MTRLLDESLTEALIAGVKDSLKRGVEPGDIYVNLAGDWTHVRNIPDPVLRYLALRSLEEMRNETTYTSPTT